MDLLIALDRLDDLVHSVPWFPLAPRRRLEPSELAVAVTDVRRTYTDAFGMPPHREEPIAAGDELIAELERAAATAQAGGGADRRQLARRIRALGDLLPAAMAVTAHRSAPSRNRTARRTEWSRRSRPMRARSR